MRIGFLLLRNTHLKTMGGLIETCLSRGYKAILFCELTPIRGAKSYQAVRIEELGRLVNIGAEVVELTVSNLVAECKEAKLDFLVTHEGYYTLKKHGEKISDIRRSGIKVVSLCHFFEIAAHPLEALDHFDKTFYLSKYAVDLHFQLNVRPEKRFETLATYSSRFEITGSPMFDKLGTLNRNRTKAAYGLPSNRPVVLLLAPVLSRITDWRFYVWRESNRAKRVLRVLRDKKWSYLPDVLFSESFYDIMKAIRDFCERSNAIFLVKSRPKQNDPGYVREIADRYFDGSDDTYYPVFSTNQLIATADLCISAMSMGIIESVAQGKSTINICIPPSLDYPLDRDLIGPSRRAYLDAVTSCTLTSPFHFQGTVLTLEKGRVGQWFKAHCLDAIPENIESVKNYQREILGISNVSSSDRILNSIESMKSGRQGLD